MKNPGFVRSGRGGVVPFAAAMAVLVLVTGTPVGATTAPSARPAIASESNDASWIALQAYLEHLKKMLKPRVQPARQSASDLQMGRSIHEAMAAYNEFGLTNVAPGEVAELESILDGIEAMCTPAPAWLPAGALGDLLGLTSQIHSDLYAE